MVHQTTAHKNIGLNTAHKNISLNTAHKNIGLNTAKAGFRYSSPLWPQILKPFSKQLLVSVGQ